MKPPAWLIEFHRRWQIARCRNLQASSRPYGTSWQRLLETCKLTTSEEQATAVREAEALAATGKVLLKRHRYRQYLVERITLPLECEPWLQDQFVSENPPALLRRSLEATERHRTVEDPLPEWLAFLDRLDAAFSSGRVIRPFSWRKPDDLDQLLTLLHKLLARDWDFGTPVRIASMMLGYDSKFLEKRQRSIASAMTEFLGIRTTLADLGLVMSESMLLSQGPLVLHFSDGTHKDFGGLAPHSLSAADLERATAISTSCQRLLTIENSKTTFRQFAAANTDGQTLLVASSFPTPALRYLLDKLTEPIEHHHFGDTDPSGFLILLKLREISPRLVNRFHMDWRPADYPTPLTLRDTRILGELVGNPLLDDCRHSLQLMMEQRDRGQYEQESCGAPTRRGWPFY